MKDVPFFLWGGAVMNIMSCFLRCLALLLVAGPLLFLSACAQRARLQESAFVESSVEQAMQAYAAGDCRSSMRLFDAVLRVRESPVVFNGLGLAQLECRQTRQAVDSLDRAVSLAPASPDLQANLGMALFEAGDYERASTAFETALRLDPFNVEALIGKAGVLLIRNMPGEALAVLKQLGPQDAERPEVMFNRGLALYQMDLYAEAEQLLRGYLAANPGDPAACNALGLTLLQLKRHAEARELLDRAIAGAPMHAEYYYNRGNLFRAMKQFPKAVEDYSRAIAHEPEYAEAFVNRGDLRFLLQEVEAGCADLERACGLGRCERLKAFQNIGRCMKSVWK